MVEVWDEEVKEMEFLVLRGKGGVLKQLPHQAITPSVTDLNLPFWYCSWWGVKSLLVYHFNEYISVISDG